jgi:AcrR family transcriptional regulator
MQEHCSRLCAIISAMSATSIRARVRAEMIAEIKAVARRHLETEGANLSLRAVARDMGMVSSALYRYFASRDELLTALIMDGYNALGDATEAADAAVAERTDLRSRWLAAARAIRDWALAQPAEYALLFGSPVPGYAAPQDTIAAAARTPTVLVGILADGFAAGVLPARDGSGSGWSPGSGRSPGMGREAGMGPEAGQLADALRADLARVRDQISPGLPEDLLLLGMTSWLQLFGIVSFELFGQFNNVIDARAEFFDQQMGLMSDLIGI